MQCTYGDREIVHIVFPGIIHGFTYTKIPEQIRASANCLGLLRCIMH